jgi:predicted metal-binding membrane protein
LAIVAAVDGFDPNEAGVNINADRVQLVATRRPTDPTDVSGARIDPANRLLIVGSLIILSGLAWAWTVAAATMPGCHLLGLGSFVVMWTVMMAAMMLPSVIPVVLAFTAFTRARLRETGHANRASIPRVAAGLFVVGYLVAWGLLGVPTYALLQAAARLTETVRAFVTLGPAVGGLLLVGCGIYQLTPLKDACLRHCRAPHLFLGHHWRDGLRGALSLGTHHGLYCAGCCASLMVVLMVVGLMNLTWMVGLSGVIYLEKIMPKGTLVGRAAGVALCAVGVARVVA